MNTMPAGKICGGQSAAVKRREKFSPLGGIGAGRAAPMRRNAVLLHGRVFTTTRRRLTGGLRFTAYVELDEVARGIHSGVPGEKRVRVRD